MTTSYPTPDPEIRTDRKSKSVAALTLFFFLIPFEGLIRMLSSKLGMPLLNLWKDFFVLGFCYVAAISMFAHRVRMGPKSRPVMAGGTLSLFFIGLFGILIAVLGQSASTMQAIWGFKILYIPILLGVVIHAIPGIGADFGATIIRKIYIISIPIVLFGVWQFFAGPTSLTTMLIDMDAMKGSGVALTTIGGFVRAFSTLREPFAFGDYCSMLFIFTLADAFLGSKNKFLLLYSVLFLAGIIVSTSRVSIITACAGIVMIGFLNSPIRVSIKRGAVMLAVVVFSGGAFVLSYIIAHTSGIYGVRGDFFSTILTTQSMMARWIQWSDILGQFPMSDPFRFLAGWGTGTLGAAQLRFAHYSYAVDNAYLFLWVMFGSLGLITWLIYLFVGLTRIVSFTTEQLLTSKQRWFFVATSAYLFGQFIEFIFRTGLEGYPGQIFFWFFWFYTLRMTQARS